MLQNSPFYTIAAGMVVGAVLLGIHMALTHGVSLAMLASYMPQRGAGTAWSFTDMLLGTLGRLLGAVREAADAGETCQKQALHLFCHIIAPTHPSSAACRSATHQSLHFWACLCAMYHPVQAWRWPAPMPWQAACLMPPPPRGWAALAASWEVPLPRCSPCWPCCCSACLGIWGGRSWWGRRQRGQRGARRREAAAASARPVNADSEAVWLG